MRVAVVVGARPNFVKAEPLLRALEAKPGSEVVLVHTGQHYDASLSADLFRDLGLRDADLHLGVGSGTRSEQLSKLITALERALSDLNPAWVVVVGDVNSTLAAALVSDALGIKIAHVEAGLRSRDRSMPEETNRVLTDRLADALFTPTAEASENLLEEGIDETRIHFVGNIMIDTLLRCLPRALELKVYRRWSLPERGYAVLTAHRPSNVDEFGQLVNLGEIMRAVASRMPVIFSVHPRTMASLERHGFLQVLSSVDNAQLLYPPPSYLEFLSLLASSRLALTDSGGIQEETTVLGVPCLTLRTNTERPVTLSHGTNRLVGVNPAAVMRAVEEILVLPMPEGGNLLPLWDGRTAERIASVLLREAWFGQANSNSDLSEQCRKELARTASPSTS